MEPRSSFLILLHFCTDILIVRGDILSRNGCFQDYFPS